MVKTTSGTCSGWQRFHLVSRGWYWLTISHAHWTEKKWTTSHLPNHHIPRRPEKNPNSDPVSNCRVRGPVNTSHSKAIDTHPIPRFRFHYIQVSALAAWPWHRHRHRRQHFPKMMASRRQWEGTLFSLPSMRPPPAAGDVCGNGTGLKKDGC